MRQFLRKWLTGFFLAIFACFVVSGTVFGDSPATPCSYSISSASGYVFVMLAPDPENECLSQGKEKAKVAKTLRERYKSSGLYSDASSLWSVDWFSYKVYLSQDGKHLVRKGPWASSGANEAFSFFDQGKLLKTYRVEDLVRDISTLPHSVSHFEWEKASSLNEANDTFNVSTLEGANFTFDLATGEIRDGGKPILPPVEALTKPEFYLDKLMWIAGLFLGLGIALFVALRRSAKS